MATLGLTEAAHLRVIQERLGHASIAMTLDRYSHVSTDLQCLGVARLDAALDHARKTARDQRHRDGLKTRYQTAIFSIVSGPNWSAVGSAQQNQLSVRRGGRGRRTAGTGRSGGSLPAARCATSQIRSKVVRASSALSAAASTRRATSVCRSSIR